MRCIFCKQDSSSTKGVEHVIPESIGNKKHVLPRGLVCDKCNNYFARKVEGPLLSHESMRNIRAWYQVPNKKGRIPSVKGYFVGTGIEVAMKAGKEGKLLLALEKVNNEVASDENPHNIESGKDLPSLIFPVDINPPKKEMSRFLAMMALETLALRVSDTGDAEIIIDDSHFDLIRNYARYGSSGVDMWPYHRRRIFPAETEMRHPETGEWVHVGFGHDLLLTTVPETYFVFVLYGVEFVINVGGPSLDGYKLWLKENNNISPIIERAGARLVEHVINGEVKYRLEGDFQMDKGVAFDKARFHRKRA